MRKLTVFNFITLNGYYKGPGEDISWHKHGAEEYEYSVEMLKTGNVLLFGRVTYEMMAGFWPTQEAIHAMPDVARGMNSAEKIVFSKKLKEVEWNNTRLVSDDIDKEVRRLKQLPGKDMTLLGSGTVLTKLAEKGLVDEYQFMIDPVAIGSGAQAFKGMKRQLDLELTGTRTFRSGTILLCYRPA